MTKKILIIEDDKILNEMYALKFQKENYDVESAFEGIEGLSKVVSFNPDIILLDLMMPSMNGFDTLKSIKTQTSSKCKIIIFTNIVDKDKISKAMKLGADDYLIKSNISPKDVVKKIEKLLTDNSTKSPIYINPGLNTFKIKNPSTNKDIEISINIQL